MKSSSSLTNKSILLKNDIAYILLVFFALTLPLSFQANGFINILIGIFVLYFSLIKKQTKFSKKVIFALPAFYFFLLLFRVDFTNYYGKSVQVITLSSTFLLLPAFFLSISISKKRIKTLFAVFAGICVLIFFLSIFYNFLDFTQNDRLFVINENGDREFIFYYSHLVKIFGLHPSYISLYISYIITVLFIHIASNLKSYSLQQKLISGITILLLVIFNFLLASRAGLLAFIACVLFVSAYDIIYRFKLKKIILYIVLLATLTFLFSKFDYTKTRFTTAYNTFFSGPEVQKIHSANSRMYIYKASLSLVEEVPFFGFGIGKDQEKLEKAYDKFGFQKGIEESFGTHNQWIKIFLSTGYFGLLIFLLILIAPLLYFKQSNKIYYSIFLVLISINFLFENMLSLQKGVVFFTFFYCLNILYLCAQKYPNWFENSAGPNYNS